MIIVYVKHYLNVSGIEYFGAWYQKVCRAIFKQPGFIGIESHKDEHDVSCVHIAVKFSDVSCLDNWIKTPAHGEVVDLLDPYRTKPWEAARSSDERQNLEALVWKKIVPRTASTGVTP